MLASFIVSLALQANSVPYAHDTAMDAAESQRWVDMIEAEQTYLLKRWGCYRFNTDPGVITRELTQGDCGKPQEIDVRAYERGRKLAMKLFELKDK